MMNVESIRFNNQKNIKKDETYQLKIKELEKIEKFLSDFGFLSFGRDYIVCQKYTFSLQLILTALELTSGSIIDCCYAGCLSDANTLLRKYRDDMFFYLYISIYDANKKLNLSPEKTDKAEENITKWIQNNLSDLKIGFVLKEIAMSPHTREAVQKYNLHKFFDQVNERLNNYVHSNGIKYYNQTFCFIKKTEFQEQLNSLVEDMRFITVTFLLLLTLSSPHSIMSTDYIEYLDNNTTPSEGSQYWVAQFIVDFFKENKRLIDDKCLEFLQDNTSMVL